MSAYVINQRKTVTKIIACPLDLETHKLLETVVAIGSGELALADAERAGYLGWEMDYFANWRVTSDLAWTIRYGAFQPGAAFENDTCRQFLYSGVTFSF